MGLLKTAINVGVGYGVRAWQDKTRDKKDYIDRKREDTQKLSLREYLDEYRNAHHIAVNTLDMDMFIDDLRNVLRDYELGV